jgi:filamentous hemagglutinin
VPPDRANSGFWVDEHAKGNTAWYSDNQKVNVITGYKPVIFKDGYPILDEYMQQTVYLPRMLGDKRDFGPCDIELARRFGRLKHDGTPNQEWGYRYRQQYGLTWHHHQDGVRMQLVPLDLHSNIPHAGGASLSTEGAAHD